MVVEAVLVNFCCYDYGVNASEALQKISTRLAGAVSQLTKKADFIATPIKKTYLAFCYLPIGYKSQVSVFFLI